MELHPYLPQPELLKFCASKGESLSDIVYQLDILTRLEGNQVTAVIDRHQHQLAANYFIFITCMVLKILV